MTRPNTTELAFVIDRSGSMSVISEAMNEGFNEFIVRQKQLPGDCHVTVVQFDDKYEVLYTGLTLAQVPPFRLIPRGSTALLDAIAKTIGIMGERLDAMREQDRPSQVLFVVITDGQENCSEEFGGTEGRTRVFDMITHQRTKYSWEFIFLGANQNAIVAAERLGVNVTNAMTFDASAVGAAAAMDCLSESVKSYREGSKDGLCDKDKYDAAKIRRQYETIKP